jgi:hypothetical protein
MERDRFEAEPDDGADNASADGASACTSVITTIDAVFEDLHKRFATICSDAQAFVVAPGGDRALIACGNRYLAYRLLPLGVAAQRTAETVQQAAPAMSLELYAISTFGGRVPTPDDYLRPQHRILTVGACRRQDGMRWKYYVPGAYQLAVRRDLVNTTIIELTTGEVVRRCAILLALTPVFPPDRIAVSRMLTR